MNNEPWDTQEKPKEENPFEINPNASLAEKRESEVRQNTGPEQEASGYTIGDKIRFRNITGTRTIEGEIREIVDSGKFKVFDSAEDRFYDINADQIEEKLPTENKPEEPKQDTVASPEKIEFATGKNSETFRMGDKVSWVSAGGFATNTGTVSSFEENNGVIFAHIKPDSDPENEIELLPDLLSPVENGVSLSKSTLVAQPSPAGPEWLEEKFNEAKDWLESKGVKVDMWSYTGGLEKWKEKVIGVVDICKQLDISPVEDLGVYFIATNPDQTDSHFFKDVSTERIINFSIGEFVDQEELAKFIKYWREHKNDQDVKTIFEEQKGYSLRDFYKKEGFGGDSIITQGGLRVSKGDKIKFENDEKKESEAIVDGFEVDELGGIRCKIRPVKKTITSRLGFSQEIVHPRKIIEVLQNSTKDPATSEPGGQEVDKKKDEVEKNVEPEWRKGPEWQAMEEARKQAVREQLTQRKSGLLTIGPKWADYENSKEAIVRMIESDLRQKAGENLTPEQEVELKRKINDLCFEELIEKEYKEKSKVEKEIGTETWGGKVKEAARYASGVKAFQWYVRQNKWVRLGAMTALAGTVGFLTGGLAAGGILAGNRLRRGTFSIVGAGATNSALQRVKSLSIEELNKAETEAIEQLKNSSVSDAEKAKKYEEIKKEFQQKRLRRGLIKGAITVAAGAGAGGLAGLLDDGPQVSSSGKNFFDKAQESLKRFGEPNSNESGALVIDNGPKGGGQDLTKVLGGNNTKEPGFFDKLMSKDLGLPKDPSYVEDQTDLPDVSNKLNTIPKPLLTQDQLNELSQKISEQNDQEVTDTTETSPVKSEPDVQQKTPEPQRAEGPEQSETENPKPQAEESVATTAKVAEGVFDNPGVEEVEVASGDSTWKILERMMENNKGFKNLSGDPEYPEEILAKKNFVISNLANEAIRNAEKIGLEADGSLNIGDKLNFSSLFNDKAKIDELMEKAENLSSDKVRNILENNAKIAKWVADPTNAGKPLTSDQVAEILAEKVETPKVVEPSSGAYYDDVETKEEAFSGKAETPMSEPNMGIASESSGIPNYNLGVKISEVDAKLESSILRNKFSSESEELQKAVAEIRKKAEELNSLDKNSEEYKAGVAELEQRTEDVEIEVQKLSKQLLQGNKNIQEMAQDLAQDQEKLARDSVRSFVAGSEPSKLSPDLSEDLPKNHPSGLQNLRSFSGDAEFNAEIQTQFEDAVDKVYGKKRILGLFGKVKGVDTPEWKQIANLPADLVLQSYESPQNVDPESPIIKMLDRSNKHKELLKGVKILRSTIEREVGSQVDLRPYENGESVEDFIKRLGGFRMRKLLNK